MSTGGGYGDADKRQKILDSAFAVFTKKGYQQTKVDEVAQLAGIGKGTVYLYFPSKEELLREMLKAMIKKNLSELKKRMSEEEHPLAKLKVMYATHASLLQENPSLAQLHIHDFAFVNEAFRAWLEQEKADFMAYIARIVEAGIKTEEFRPVNPNLAAALIISCLSVFLPPYGSDTFSVDDVLDILHYGLCQSLPPRP
ncbi:TetR/AcrR family fatty acid metabolism transcriptional regulator [Caldalkalibacillus uzonensis]|uniref:TetR/AcrR family fatty acid metabolism transcriptional regulator n=1 Tax=Caldalkalibacillus uzonensis TaxID=353224 RepID=A0ABU0CTZ9_9BACI|nr:TetR/AcrR family transcriptional regulator [Caldalkalibacillus uzonensis]MDQ0339573.1 TetR/AcrR family fatty acid metabolism transcriptional regulator [Caldalkalibacillus uzonensis]